MVLRSFGGESDDETRRPDDELCAAVAEVAKDQGNDLGGGVWKKRLSHNRERSIILTKNSNFWVYEFLFAKADSEAISATGLTALRKIAAGYEETLADASVALLMKDQGWKEICNAESEA